MKAVLAITAPLLATFAAHEAWADSGALPGLTRIQTTLVDDSATHWAVTHSHNQKVLWNSDGIFMSYDKRRAEGRPLMRGTWRLMRSTDGGASFRVAHEGHDGYTTPVIENLPGDRIGLGFSNQDNGATEYYRFRHPIDSGPPDHVAIPDTNPRRNGGKFSMLYDHARDQIYWLAKPNRLTVFKPDGKLVRHADLFADGPVAHVEYPHLRLDDKGTLHTAWTTCDNKAYLYRSIHYARSADGGKTWRKMDGTALALPFVSDSTGPSDMLNLADELDVHTWLQSMAIEGGRLHLAYLAQAPLDRNHYMRCNLATARRERDVVPLRGERIEPKATQGFIFADAAHSGTTIYYVTRAIFGNKQHVGCIASDDGGATWYDYAMTPTPFAGVPSNVGGCRSMTADRCLIGSFTDVRSKGHDNRVYFYKIQLGLSRAELLAAEDAGGAKTFRFGRTRGQPSHIRFRSGMDDWSAWMKFGATVQATLLRRPTHYQLRSRLGTESEPSPIAVPAAMRR